MRRIKRIHARGRWRRWPANEEAAWTAAPAHPHLPCRTYTILTPPTAAAAATRVAARLPASCRADMIDIARRALTTRRPDVTRRASATACPPCGSEIGQCKETQLDIVGAACLRTIDSHIVYVVNVCVCVDLPSRLAALVSRSCRLLFLYNSPSHWLC